MTILAFGINHNTAPLALREKAAVSNEALANFLKKLTTNSNICEVVVLSTCNRTEIYCDSHDEQAVLLTLAQHMGLLTAELNEFCYQFRDYEAVKHIMRVACGLDSLIIGEPQILGQLKTAVALAETYHTVGPQFKRLFQQVFHVAKHVRTHTEIGVCPVSIAANAVKLAKQVIGNIHEANVLLIGAGETSSLAAKYFTSQNVKEIFIASRHLDKAQELALTCQGKSLLLEDIHDHLVHIDIVFSATASHVPLLGKGAVENALRLRANRPMCLLDMAVPRDIEPEVAELNAVYLYTIDDLKSVIDTHHQSRLHAAQKAELMIAEHAEKFMRWCNSLDSMLAIRLFREHIQNIHTQELNKALHMLQQGAPAETVITHLAHSLTNKLMHHPTVQMRQASYAGQLDTLKLMQEMFGLQI